MFTAPLMMESIPFLPNPLPPLLCCFATDPGRYAGHRRALRHEGRHRGGGVSCTTLAPHDLPLIRDDSERWHVGLGSRLKVGSQTFSIRLIYHHQSCLRSEQVLHMDL